MKKSLSQKNSEKMLVENIIWTEKKFDDVIDEKYVDQKKPANGNVQNREGI